VRYRQTGWDLHIHLLNPDKERGETGEQNVGRQNAACLNELARKWSYQTIQWADWRGDAGRDSGRNHPEPGEIEVNELADFGWILIRNQGTEVLVSG
jgi:hypothetical protein